MIKWAVLLFALRACGLKMESRAMKTEASCNPKDFETSAMGCLQHITGIARSTATKYMYDDRLSIGMVHVMKLGLKSPEILDNFCKDLAKFLPCQNEKIKAGKANWRHCKWWIELENGYLSNINGFNEACLQSFPDFAIATIATCIKTQVDSLLAQRCWKIFSLRNKLKKGDECSLSNEYLGCLNILIKDGCSEKAERIFRLFAPYTFGVPKCANQYNYQAPFYAYSYEKRCLSESQEELMKCHSNYKMATNVFPVTFQKAEKNTIFPIINRDNEYKLNGNLCKSLDNLQRCHENYKTRCRIGFELITAALKWKPRLFQLQYICDNIEVYKKNVHCIRSASVGRCSTAMQKAKRIMWNRWKIFCAEYYKEYTKTDLQKAWNESTNCLEGAIMDQCGFEAAQLFRILIEFQQNINMFEMSCDGAFEPKGFEYDTIVQSFTWPKYQPIRPGRVIEPQIKSPSSNYGYQRKDERDSRKCARRSFLTSNCILTTTAFTVLLHVFIHIFFQTHNSLSSHNSC